MKVRSRLPEALIQVTDNPPVIIPPEDEEDGITKKKAAWLASKNPVGGHGGPYEGISFRFPTIREHFPELAPAFEEMLVHLAKEE